MDEKKWQEALKLSRFTGESEAVHAKVMPVLDYLARLARYTDETKVAHEEDYSLTQVDLRRDEVGDSFSPSILKKMSKSFLDSYFAVPKVFDDGGDA